MRPTIIYKFRGISIGKVESTLPPPNGSQGIPSPWVIGLSFTLLTSMAQCVCWGEGGGGRLVKQIYAFTGCGRGVVLLGFEIVKFGFQGVLNCLVGVSIVFK